jgi:hypothetical protein
LHRLLLSTCYLYVLFLFSLRQEEPLIADGTRAFHASQPASALMGLQLYATIPIGMLARMKVIKRQTAEYIRDYAEELALMADGIKLTDVGRALQQAALLAQNAADKLGASRSNLRVISDANTGTPRMQPDNRPAEATRPLDPLNELAKLLERGNPADMERIAELLGNGNPDQGSQ